jgi:cysteine desulfurase/selenocysteine lyase
MNDLHATDIRRDFEIFSREINGHPLIYLDNAATTQKPRQVLDTLLGYYTTNTGNIHRGIHTLAEESTMMYEQARKNVQHFLNAASSEEIIFTSGTTSALNMIARFLIEQRMQKGDAVLTTVAEHHANFIPWQELCKQHGYDFLIADITDEGYINLDDIREKLAHGNVKVLTVTHVSNVLGIINPIKELTALAHEHGAICVVDGAQSAPHMPIDVQEMDVDCFVFSGHKMLAPTGIGAMYIKKALGKNLHPVVFGGGIINDVTVDHASYADAPVRFEPGTPPIAEAIALGSAVDYLRNIGMEHVLKHELEMASYALEQLSTIQNIEILGSRDPANRIGVICFTHKEIHPHDIAAVLNSEGIAVRSGKHCAHPLFHRLGRNAAVRLSTYIYNTKADIDAAVSAISKAEIYFEH